MVEQYKNGNFQMTGIGGTKCSCSDESTINKKNIGNNNN